MMNGWFLNKNPYNSHMGKYFNLDACPSSCLCTLHLTRKLLDGILIDVEQPYRVARCKL